MTKNELNEIAAVGIYGTNDSDNLKGDGNDTIKL